MTLFTDAFSDALADSLRLLPFLFAAYLLLELLEHKAGEQTERFLRRAGAWGPVAGATAGLLPQCGFSAAAANFYAGGLIARGTLLAVFLATSDEMLPLFIAGGAPLKLIAAVLAIKWFSGILVGFAVNAAESKKHLDARDFCDREGCRCEEGILKSAAVHSGKILLFLFLVNLGMNLLIGFIGVENLSRMVWNRPVVGEVLAGLIGLIPNCASSVVIASLYLKGGISAGAMLSGLLTGSGVGLLVLFRMNRDREDNLLTLAILYGAGVVLGLLLGPLFGFLA